ncbi:hypothetical protein D083_3176 [Dickeya solani RNS 08.23.3.1.A]|nr:hypothetical protein D083_3176 [Dickeya solani RNS 08.23.3.1.A]
MLLRPDQSLRELPPDRLPCWRAATAIPPRALLFSGGNINPVDVIEIESPHQAALQ